MATRPTGKQLAEEICLQSFQQERAFRFFIFYFFGVGKGLLTFFLEWPEGKTELEVALEPEPGSYGRGARAQGRNDEETKVTFLSRRNVDGKNFKRFRKHIC